MPPRSYGLPVPLAKALKRRAEFIRDAVVAEVERREAETIKPNPPAATRG